MRRTLATRFVLIISGVAALGLLNGVTALVFTRWVANSLHTSVSDNFSSVKAAEELKVAMSDQMGRVFTYIVSAGRPLWLEQTHKAEAEFQKWLSRAWESAHTPTEFAIFARLQKAYADYDAELQRALLQFSQGQRSDAISTLIDEVWPAYDKARQCSEEFIAENEGYIAGDIQQAERYVGFATWGVLIGSLSTAGLSVVLLGLVIFRVLIPLRRMVSDARIFMSNSPGGAATLEPADDELRSVAVYFRTLMVDMAETRTTLAESRSRMLNAEKLASVGKLAASVAHEMRNPLSSMKMWLYSIRKTAGAEPALDHKYQILADEIVRLENIVRNVLEFSRSPALKLQPQEIVPVLEKTLEFVRPWLETKNIRVAQNHAAGLPQVRADSEQLMQVFANLLDNAAEAMPQGGEISITSVAETDASGAARVVVRIQDTGQGIPDNVRSRLFEPFFTTKDEGTGLGLCIAANILARHGGQLVLESATSGGTTFAVRIPLATEKGDEQDSRR